MWCPSGYQGLTIPGEHLDGVVWQQVDLAALAVVLELRQEVALKLPQRIRDALTDLGQHRLEGDAYTFLLNQNPMYGCVHCPLQSPSMLGPMYVLTGI